MFVITRRTSVLGRNESLPTIRNECVEWLLSRLNNMILRRIAVLYNYVPETNGIAFRRSATNATDASMIFVVKTHINQKLVAENTMRSVSIILEVKRQKYSRCPRGRRTSPEAISLAWSFGQHSTLRSDKMELLHPMIAGSSLTSEIPIQKGKIINLDGTATNRKRDRSNVTRPSSMIHHVR